MEFREPKRALDEVRKANEDVGHIHAGSLRKRWCHLVEMMKQWVSNSEANAKDADACVMRAQGYSGTERSLYVQYLSAMWAQDTDALKKLLPLALDDLTTADAVLGRMLGVVKVQDLDQQQVERLLRYARLREPVTENATSSAQKGLS
jgi:hypothetical protein